MPSYNLKVRLFVLLLVCLLLWQTLRYFPSLSPFSDEGSNSKWTQLHGTTQTIVPLPVAVYYEALCPDSRSFFVKQLLPAFDRAPRLMTISLVPYGKAKTEKYGPSYVFTCQHGPVECKANKVHACAIAMVPQPDTVLRYLTCMIADNMEPMEIGKSCAAKFNIPWDPIEKCALGDQGNELLKMYGDETHALRPKASFIPTILLDGSQDGQPAILKNLLKEVCRKFESRSIRPIECNASDVNPSS